MKHQVLIHDAVTRTWLNFCNPQLIVAVHNCTEIGSALERVETIVEEQGMYAAGFISYEASPAFDSALRVRASNSFPLLWFGLYSTPGIMKLPYDPSENSYLATDWTPTVDKEEYKRAVVHIKECIARGETYQVNYTFRLRAPFSCGTWPLFLHLIRTQQAEYGAYVDTGRFVICSASPELFFRLNGRTLTTRPMKGTAPRGCTLTDDNKLAEWLYNSEKNRAENVMIVDMMRNDLGRIALQGSVKVKSLFDIERYPTVWQMTSTISAESEASVNEIIRALFPCASITGAPKPHTTGIIADLETAPRSIYTGCIGFIAPGRKAQFNVAIRTVLVDRKLKQAEYGVGGGIVWDSSTDEEYRECLVKARVLHGTKTEFSLIETILWTPDENYFLLGYHLRRMCDSAKYFGMAVNIDCILGKLSELENTFPMSPMKVRLLVSRDGSVSLESTQMNNSGQEFPVLLRLASVPVDSTNPFHYHKTTNREIYPAGGVMPGSKDILLWNERGEVTETTTANVVFQFDDELVTPPVSSGLLPGTFRAWMIDRKEVKEKVVMLDDIKRCSAIFIINSVRKKREAFLEKVKTQ
ncbi:MAG: aminodeoxychorismate synthase component I [Candidatus Latescibacterota bacterium]